MADVLQKTAWNVHLKVRVSRSEYQRLVETYGCEALALAALRNALPDLVEKLARREPVTSS